MSQNIFTSKRTLAVYSLASNHSVLYRCEAEQGMQEPLVFVSRISVLSSRKRHESLYSLRVRIG